MDSVTHLPLCEFVNYQQQSVTAYSATYKLLFQVMFCDLEQNSSQLINSTKSIQLSLGKCHREAVQHAKEEPKEMFQVDEERTREWNKLLQYSSQIIPNVGNHSKRNSRKFNYVNKTLKPKDASPAKPVSVHHGLDLIKQNLLHWW